MVNGLAPHRLRLPRLLLLPELHLIEGNQIERFAFLKGMPPTNAEAMLEFGALVVQKLTVAFFYKRQYAIKRSR